MKLPSDYNLPHPEFREHQLESIQFCLDQEEGDVATIEAPTGSGKTSFSAATSTEKRVIALCKNKNLQRANYDEGYGATPMYGRVNYPCIHPETLGDATCADCIHLDRGMQSCEYAKDCRYLVAREAALASPYAVLNYAYWMASAAFRRKSSHRVLFLDECHELDEIVCDWVGCTVEEWQVRKWNLPPLPRIEHARKNELLDLAPPADLALDWLGNVYDRLDNERKKLGGGLRANQSQRTRERFRQCNNFALQVKSTIDAIHDNSEDWYIRSGPYALVRHGYVRPGFQAKPLTARYDFGRFFLSSRYATISMSATVGDPDQFSEELGIDEQAFRVVPSRFPPGVRPVYVLDVPSMGSKHKADWSQRAARQADAIASFIQSFDPSWSGLIHVTRKTEERDLRYRLASRGLGHRVWAIPGKVESSIPTDKQLDQWNERKRRVPNSILVTCSFGTGYDGLDEKINVSAKVPYPVMGGKDSYSRAWMYYDGRRYRQKAATRLAQQMGRTRRGREQDYDTNGQINGACAIADGALSQVQRYLPPSLVEALTTW